MFSAKHLQTGQIGENLATEFLESRGFEIITRNYQTKWGEIDIVAKSKKGILSFIEVKTLTAGNNKIRQYNNEGEDILDLLKPEDNLTKSKLLKLQKVCQYFANRNPKLIDEKLGWEINLITIQLPSKNISLLTREEKDSLIKFYENISLSV